MHNFKERRRHSRQKGAAQHNEDESRVLVAERDGVVDRVVDFIRPVGWYCGLSLWTESIYSSHIDSLIHDISS